MSTKKNTTETNTTAKEYTHLYSEDMGEIVADATDNLVANRELADDITERFEVEEYEDADGTFFIEYDAKTWRDAAAFNAAIIGQAFAFGFFAEQSAKWEDELKADDGRRHVSVFVAAADYMTDDGHAVI